MSESPCRCNILADYRCPFCEAKAQVLALAQERDSLRAQVDAVGAEFPGVREAWRRMRDAAVLAARSEEREQCAEQLRLEAEKIRGLAGKELEQLRRRLIGGPIHGSNERQQLVLDAQVEADRLQVRASVVDDCITILRTKR